MTEYCMQGGYLRVMYPAPELCLNLETWQEFCGNDLEGDYAWFAFDLDPETMSLSVCARSDAPLHAPGPARPVQVQRDPSAVGLRKSLPFVPGDIAGDRRSEMTLPGPFSSWEGILSLKEGIPACRG